MMKTHSLCVLQQWNSSTNQSSVANWATVKLVYKTIRQKISEKNVPFEEFEYIPL